MGIPSPYFTNVAGYGDLEMDEILVDYDYPLIFVLVSSSGQRFICRCYDVTGIKEDVMQYWAVASISNENLVKLLHNQVSINDGFEMGDVKIVISWSYRDKKDRYQFVDKFPEEALLDDSDYLDAEIGEWDEYIKELV